MQPAPLPENEAQRLAALVSYCVLDTPQDAILDGLTWLASNICGTPIALISLIDEHRQWFKSRVGLDAEETPRELAFCAHAILGEEVFEVPNALEDPRFADNPLVASDPSIRFYAGAPLESGSGYNVGTICVIDRVARKLSDLQREMLVCIGRQVVAHLESVKAHNLVLAEVQRKNDELVSFHTRFELATVAAGIGSWEWDLVTNSLSWDDRMFEIYDVAKEGFLGANVVWERSLHPDDKERAVREIQEAVAAGTKFHTEFRIITSAAETRYVEAWGDIQRFPDGRPYKMVGANLDVTERKKAAALFEGQAKAIAASQAVIEYAMDGAILSANDLFLGIVGYRREKLLGGRHSLFVSPEEEGSPEYREFWIGLRRGEFRSGEFKRYAKGGRLVWMQATYTPVLGLDGQFEKVVKFATDISARKMAEEQREEAQHAAERANKAKSSFLANMSHEIRTPMNGILGLTEILLNTGLTASQRRYQNLVQQSAESLLIVLNDILDFSKIEAGKMDLEKAEFPLRDSIADMLQILALRAAEKGLELGFRVHSEVPDCLVGDVVRLRQVITNLVGNAIKFTAKGEVFVEVRQEELIHGQVRVHVLVSDTGIGIPEDRRADIFTAFTQAEESTTRRFGGTGLGLSISQQLVELMGGRIWLESELGKGSVFHFSALMDVGTPQDSRPCGLPEFLAALPVLVLDTSSNRIGVDELLRSWNARPLLVSSWAGALEALDGGHRERHPIAVLILNVETSGVDISVVTRELSERYAADAPKVLALVAGKNAMGLATSEGAGIARVLSKPVKASDLFNAIIETMSFAKGVSGAACVPEEDGAARVRSMNVLLAEDGATNQVLATKFLEVRGHAVTIANNGSEAVELSLRGDFDAILMDVQMPVMNGYEATGAIRKREQQTGKRIPIIAMTANAMSGDREKCLAAGMDDYLSKPIRSQVLYEVLEKYAARKQAEPGDGNKEQGPGGADAEVLPAFDAKEFETEMGDVALMKQLIEMFPAEAEKRLRELKGAVEVGDVEGIERGTHALIGMLGNYAAMPAMRSVQELSRCAGHGPAGELGVLFTKVEQELKGLGSSLERFQQTL